VEGSTNVRAADLQAETDSGSDVDPTTDENTAAEASASKHEPSGIGKECQKREEGKLSISQLQFLSNFVIYHRENNAVK
jgi:hypothetical protein